MTKHFEIPKHPRPKRDEITVGQVDIRRDKIDPRTVNNAPSIALFE